MIAEDQSATIAFLTRALTRDRLSPETIDTHISHVFLAGDRAYKMKRAVKLPYVDFSSPGKRLAACRKEVELNAPTAPGIYLGVRTITRESDGRLAFEGTGPVVDAVVEMRRFDQTLLLDRIAGSGGLTASMMTDVSSAAAGRSDSCSTEPSLTCSAWRAVAASLSRCHAGWVATSRTGRPSSTTSCSPTMAPAVNCGTN